jgi:tetratricopeptide (TPR) repeat protein
LSLRDALYNFRQESEAISSATEACNLAEELLAADPGSAEIRAMAVKALERAGTTLHVIQSRNTEALLLIERARTIALGLIAADSENKEYHELMFYCESSLGNCLSSMGRLKEAIESLKHAIASLDKFADPSDPIQSNIPRMGLTETLTCGCTVPGRVYAG